MAEIGIEQTGAATAHVSAADRLDGVGQIAAYLECTIDAVYYARRVGLLPIRRLGRKGSLYAFRSELDAAQKADSTLPEKWIGELGSAAA